jgi:hypothetical protein
LGPSVSPGSGVADGDGEGRTTGPELGRTAGTAVGSGGIVACWMIAGGGDPGDELGVGSGGGGTGVVVGSGGGTRICGPPGAEGGPTSGRGVGEGVGEGESVGDGLVDASACATWTGAASPQRFSSTSAFCASSSEAPAGSDPSVSDSATNAAPARRSDRITGPRAR